MKYIARVRGFTLVELLVVIVIFGFILAILSSFIPGCNGPKADITISVTKTETTSEGGRFVYTPDETFKVERSWQDGSNSPATLYGRLEPGKTYDVSVRGWRNEPWGYYRNIVVLRRVHEE